MKKLKILCIAACCCLPWLISGCNSDGFAEYTYADADKYVTGGGEAESKDITALDIDWVNGKVGITVSDEAGKIAFSEENSRTDEKYRMRYYIDGTVLKIKFAQNGADISQPVAGWTKELNVVLPAEAAKKYDSVKINSVSADIVADGFGTESFKAATVSGGLNATGLNADECETDTVSGNYVFTDCNVGGGFNANSVSGGIDFNGSISGKIDIDTVSGGIELNLSVVPGAMETDTTGGNTNILLPAVSGFTVDFDTTSGSFGSSLAVKHSGSSFVYE